MYTNYLATILYVCAWITLRLYGCSLHFTHNCKQLLSCTKRVCGHIVKLHVIASANVQIIEKQL